MEKYRNKKAFTLVELIIVITILAILATIAFLSFNSYTSNARDWSRVITLQMISEALEIAKIKQWNYPIPDSIYWTWEILWTSLFQVGKIEENVANILWFNTVPTDPLSGDHYLYWLSLDNKHFSNCWNSWNTPVK